MLRFTMDNPCWLARVALVCADHPRWCLGVSIGLAWASYILTITGS